MHISVTLKNRGSFVMWRGQGIIRFLPDKDTCVVRHKPKPHIQLILSLQTNLFTAFNSLLTILSAQTSNREEVGELVASTINRGGIQCAPLIPTGLESEHLV